MANKNNNVKVVNSIDDLKTLKRHNSFKFICSKCGCEQIIYDFDYRYYNSYEFMLCTKCKHDKFVSGNPGWNNKMYETIRKNNGGKLHIETDEYVTWLKDMRSKHPEWNEKTQMTIHNKFDILPILTEESREKAKLTRKNRTGSEYPSRNPYYYKSNLYHSSWELYFVKYCELMNIPVTRNTDSFEYIVDGIVHVCVPDFKWGNRYIEIKGNQFFKNKDPNSDKMLCPFSNDGDTKNDISHRNKLYDAKYKCMKERGVIFITENEMKSIIKIVNSEYNKRYFDYFKKSYLDNLSKIYVMDNLRNIVYFDEYTPYDISRTNMYTDFSEKQITPFDII